MNTRPTSHCSSGSAAPLAHTCHGREHASGPLFKQVKLILHPQTQQQIAKNVALLRGCNHSTGRGSCATQEGHRARVLAKDR